MSDSTTESTPKDPHATKLRDNLYYEQMRRRQKTEAKAEQYARQQFIAFAEKASAHHPEIPQQVFRDIITAYDLERAEFAKAENKTAPEDMAELRRETLAKIKARLSEHGDLTTKAMHAISTEKQPESMFTPLVRLFYNTDKGGLQLGGIGGAAALGGIGYFLTSSSGAGSWLTWGVTAATTLLGAYVGSQAFPSKSTVNTPNFRTPYLKPDGPERSPEITPDSPEPEQKTTKAMPDVKLPDTGIRPAPDVTAKTNGYIPDTKSLPQPEKTLEV